MTHHGFTQYIKSIPPSHGSPAEGCTPQARKSGFQPMHREITQSDRALGTESRASLYLLTAFLGLLMIWDIWPWVSGKLGDWLGLALPTIQNEVGGFRVALLAAVLGGARVLYGSLDSLLAGRLGADLALAIACISAILIREPLVAAEVVFIGLLGECLEGFTFERTQNALRKMLELFPRRCWRIRTDGTEERIEVAQIQVGDLIRVKPGARIPADGLIHSGSTAVDTSALTGESIPVEKYPGDEVLAGCFNRLGAIDFKVLKAGTDTVAGRVFELTVQALGQKNQAEKKADALARWFLPVVLSLAFITFLASILSQQWGWFRPQDYLKPSFGTAARNAIYPALSILVVACPCALILATPAAVIAAMGRLAGTGILIKGGSVLEKLAKVQAFAFDKTGTLTEASLEVGETWIANGNEEEIIRLAGSAESASEHPLGKVLVAFARGKGIALSTPSEFTALPGFGVRANLDNQAVLVGSLRLIQDQGIAIEPQIVSRLMEMESRGQTVLVIALNNKVQSLIGVRDRIRPEAFGVINRLRAMGIQKFFMLTGDRETVARQVGQQLGIENIHAGLLPQDKQSVISEIARTEKVAMVGDGLNDAPALARADVGLAIGGSHGIEAAAEAGDVVLMGAPLRSLPLLVSLSRATEAVIEQNILYFAFGVNIAGIFLTGWIWPWIVPQAWAEQSPLAAVIYHQIGSFLVLLNSMRLLWHPDDLQAVQQGSLQKSWDKLATFLDKALDIDEHLHNIGHFWKPISLAGLLLGFLLWLSTGFVQISSSEKGYVLRFGKLQEGELEPGLHWRFPYPIDQVKKLSLDRVRIIEIGFRNLRKPGAAPEGRSWNSPHEGDGYYRVPDESVMITGDGNLMELQGSVRYRIIDPVAYLFHASDPDAMIRAHTEAVLREMVASKKLGSLLTLDRGNFQTLATTRLASRIQQMGGEGPGIILDGLSLHDMHPPQEVVRSYYAVTQAMELRDRKINDAQASVMLKEADEHGRALQKVRTAEANSGDITRKALAQTEVFLRLLQFKSGPGNADDYPLIMQGLFDSIASKNPVQAANKTIEEIRLRRQSWVTLSEFRRFWNTLSGSMAGREKVLIDTDKPIKSNLWMFPLDLIRPSATSTPPVERGKGSRSSGDSPGMD